MSLDNSWDTWLGQLVMFRSAAKQRQGSTHRPPMKKADSTFFSLPHCSPSHPLLRMVRNPQSQLKIRVLLAVDPAHKERLVGMRKRFAELKVLAR